MIRKQVHLDGFITSKKKKEVIDEAKTYEIYYDFSEAVKTIKPHRVLAINRGEKEKQLSVNIVIDSERIIKYLSNDNIKNEESICSKYVLEAIEDSYKRLIFPSIEREVRSELTAEANEQAIKIFSENLKIYCCNHQ